ncbi:hypothetical protein, partial [Escherichia coli]|uniref:hypothetical protein n=1 Tax=Escherichia coli TaxID=562 RepID=UPI001BB1B2B3
HNRARILRKTNAFDKYYSQYTKKKHTTCTVTFISAIFSVQSPYITNHKPYVDFVQRKVIGAKSQAISMNFEKINALTAQIMEV